MKLKPMWLAMAALLVAATSVLALIRSSRMPGRFVYVAGMDYIEHDWRGRHDVGYSLSLAEYNAKMQRTYSRLSLSLSQDKRSMACFSTKNEDIDYIVIASTPSQAKHKPGETHLIDLRRYAVPYCPLSNLEWSPDGKQLAYADIHNLYLIDIKTRQLLSAKLPGDPDVTVLLREWDKHDGSPHKSPELTSLPHSSSRAFRGKAGDNPSNSLGRTTGIDVPGLWGPVADWALSPAAQAVVKRSRSEMIAALKLNNPDSVPETHYWAGLYHWVDDMDLGHSGSVRFSQAGHHLRWVSADTLLCDNWQLSLEKDKPDHLRMSAKKIPVFSSYNVRPIWNRTGTKAAYLVPRWDRKRDLYDMGLVDKRPCELVVTDRLGTVIARRSVMSADGWLCWSDDDRYVATRGWAVPREHGGNHHIFEVSSVQGRGQWQVRVPHGDPGLEITMPSCIWYK